MGVRQLVHASHVLDVETSTPAEADGRRGDLSGQVVEDCRQPGGGERHTPLMGVDVGLAAEISWELLDDLAEAGRALWRARTRALAEDHAELAGQLERFLAQLPEQRKARRT